MPPRVPLSSSSRALSKPSPRTHCKSCLDRAFSTTQATSARERGPPQLPTQHRRAFFEWLEGPGEAFRHPLANSTNYLSAYDRKGNLVRGTQDSEAETETAGLETADSLALEAAAEPKKLAKETAEDLRPYPLNKQFLSQSILSEGLRLEIWRRVQQSGKSIRQVSADMGVDMRRVGAVVRLVELERRMKSEGKQLAIPYARAIHSMVPLTHVDERSGKPVEAHESINDLEQHPLTLPQIFWPTSESRPFNRTDAGRVFSGAPRLLDDVDVAEGRKPAKEPWEDNDPELIGKPGNQKHVLKPADSRIPHPHLIAYAKDQNLKSGERQQRYQDRLREDQVRQKEAKDNAEAREESRKTRIDTGRWQFVVTEVQATRQGTGLDGRGGNSPGVRYGVPSQERKRGHVKIPTKVRV